MSVIYMPTETCPKCPFNTLCKEEKLCPISQQTPANIPDIKEELRHYAKIKNLENPAKILHQLQAPRRDQSD